MWKNNFYPIVRRQDDGSVRVEIWNDMEEVGTLYFDRPKRGWNKKPILSKEWACIDAHIEYFGEILKDQYPDVTSKDIIEWGREEIRKVL